MNLSGTQMNNSMLDGLKKSNSSDPAAQLEWDLDLKQYSITSIEQEILELQNECYMMNM